MVYHQLIKKYTQNNHNVWVMLHGWFVSFVCLLCIDVIYQIIYILLLFMCELIFLNLRYTIRFTLKWL